MWTCPKCGTKVDPSFDVCWACGTLPTVAGDSAMLRLVVRNLVANALKYTRPRARAEITVGCSEAAAEWVFRFADNGGEAFCPKCGSLDLYSLPRHCQQTGWP